MALSLRDAARACVIAVGAVGVTASGAGADIQAPAAVPAQPAPGVQRAAASANALADKGLAADAAAIVAMGAAKGAPTAWPVRVTFLGWTSDHGAIYRT